MSGLGMQQRTIPYLLGERASSSPDEPFVLFEDQIFSYATVETMSRRVAAGLQKRGIGKGSKVAVIMRNRPEFLFVWFGLNKLGAVEVPIHTEHRGEVLRHMLGISDSVMVVTEPDYLAQTVEMLVDLPGLKHVIVVGDSHDLECQGRLRESFDELTDNTGEYVDAEVLWSDPFGIMFTSGTTGVSKGALLPHNYAVSTAGIFVERLAIGPDDRYYVTMPLYHLGAQFGAVMPALRAGISVVLTERFSVRRFLGDVRRYDCTLSNYAGGMLAMIASADPQPDDAVNPLRLLNGSGAPPDLHRAFEERFGVQLMNEGYGMTEIGAPLLGSLEDPRPGTCGKRHPDYDVKIVDDDGVKVGLNTPGELLVRPRKPYCMMLEYYNMPRETMETWGDLWFHTGDILMELDDGHFTFVDRKKDALRRRGENISSFEVESAVNKHPAVLQSAVVAVPSGMGDDDVMLCVTLQPDMTLGPDELIRHCREHMARFMVPRYVRVVDDLPHTPTQRVRKHVLREQGLTADTWDREKGGDVTRT
jgi:crotonobetaine/carnitine-CoA ligase